MTPVTCVATKVYVQGIEPEASRMAKRCDTTTPQASSDHSGALKVQVGLRPVKSMYFGASPGKIDAFGGFAR